MPPNSLSNTGLQRFLLRKEMAQPLETLLGECARRLGELNRLRQETRFKIARKSPRKDLSGTMRVVKQEVDDFLGMRDLSTPKIRYQGFRYHRRLHKAICCGVAAAMPPLLLYTGSQPLSLQSALVGLEAIMLWGVVHNVRRRSETNGSQYLPGQIVVTDYMDTGLERFADIRAVIRHEYIHHVQLSKGLFQRSTQREFQALIEGHAKGIDHLMSQEWQRRTGDPSHVYFATFESVLHLKLALVWIYRRFGINPRSTNLDRHLNIDVSPMFGRRGQLKAAAETMNYAVGHVLMLHWERLQGKGIYAAALEGDFSFSKR